MLQKSVTLNLLQNGQKAQNLESCANSVSPKKAFEKREKALRLKFGIIFLISQLMWLFIHFAPDNKIIKKKSILPIEKDHKIIQIPAIIYSELPKKNTKTKVHLKHSLSRVILTGYLRGVSPDPYALEAFKAQIEIKQSDITYIQNLGEKWKIYPFSQIEPKSTVVKKRSAYEIKF